MRNQARWFFWRLFEIADVIALLACFGVSLGVYLFRSSIADTSQLIAAGIRVFDVMWIGLLAVIWHFVLAGCGLYRNRRFSSFRAEIIDLAKAAVGVVTTYAVVAFLTRRTPFSLQFLALFASLVASLLVASRALIRSVLFFLRRNNRNVRFVLIAGTNLRALTYAGIIQSQREMGFRLVGFCDDEWEGMEAFRQQGHALVCALSGIEEYVRHHVVDEVFIALPLGSHYRRIREIVAVCEEQGIRVRYGTDLFETKVFKPQADHLGETSTILHHSTNMIGWRAFVKRVCDLFVATLVLIVASPIMIAAAIAIKLTSRGPVVFAQQRLGLNKRIFRMYKFRSMVQNAESLQKQLETRNEARGPVFKIKNDPRITPVGRFLRKTSIDELPQLFNVIKGDMSIIGPRPLPLRDYLGFENDAFRRRMSVLPGITCIWQSSGRNNIPFETWMNMDLEYIDHWSLLGDVRILAKTFMCVLKGTGAA